MTSVTRSALAVAEELGAVALIDERDATRIGRSHGVDAHGTIWLLASACRNGKLTEVAASNLVDTLAATGMRLPCTGADFLRYTSANGLL
jgi:predicted nucleic acid-binding protein